MTNVVVIKISPTCVLHSAMRFHAPPFASMSRSMQVRANSFEGIFVLNPGSFGYQDDPLILTASRFMWLRSF